jgi:flagellar biogenesis protein FliO
MLPMIAAVEVQSLTSVSWLDYARLMLVLGGILIVAYLGVRYWLPRMAGGLRALSSGPIQVLAQLPLEARKTLYVVKAGRSVMLLASSEAGVQLMTALDPVDFPEASPGARSNGANDRNFLYLLNSIKNRKSS